MARVLPLALVLVPVALIALPFLTWGDALEGGLTGDGAIAWLRGHGGVAWIAAIGLLSSDILLPIPSSAILAALGMLYGPAIGGAVGTAGMIVAGLLGYGLCRWLGRPLMLRVLDAGRLRGAERRLHRHGAWIIGLSRWVPVLAELIVFAAGLAGMPFRRFAAALALGSIPVGFFYAGLGHGGSEHPLATLLACLALPALLWAGAAMSARTIDRRGAG